MRMLVATALTQGAHAGDYHWCVEGEPVWVQEPCAPIAAIPMGRADAGTHSPACIRIEPPRRQGSLRTRASPAMTWSSFSRRAWVMGWPVEWAADVAEEMLELASRWPAGTVIDRRVDQFRARRS